MTYSIYLALILASVGRRGDEDTAGAAVDLSDVLEPALARLRGLVDGLRRGPVSPLAAAEFERDLQRAIRELGRVTVQWAYNHLEPADREALPTEVHHAGSRFRRLTKKTPKSVSTLFGAVTLHRRRFAAGCSRGASGWRTSAGPTSTSRCVGEGGVTRSTGASACRSAAG